MTPHALSPQQSEQKNGHVYEVSGVPGPVFLGEWPGNGRWSVKVHSRTEPPARVPGLFRKVHDGHGSSRRLPAGRKVRVCHSGSSANGLRTKLGFWHSFHQLYVPPLWRTLTGGCGEHAS